ncbi:MAG: MBL fold metallo-hydrolase [Acidobacteria bacterium]|nr:MBL fold metallo-hydrolase [Acidobacteriota bacterium]
MKACGFALAVLVSLWVGGAVAQAQRQSSAGGAAPNLAAAKAAAQHANAARLFGTLCVPPPPIRPPQAAAPAGAQPPATPARAQWHAEPVKVFDNLYWVGQTEYTAWAVLTSDGIIVVDALFDYSVGDEVVDGLTKLGLDPKQIKYVLVSHAHSDHVGGARLLQERFGARVVMSATDWDLLESDPGRWPKAKRDMVATDGQKLTLGDTTLTLYMTPGHTLGTISTIIPLKDGGRTHTAALWGGTGFNWRSGSPRYITPARPAQFWYEQYSSSARRFREVAAKAGADVLLSNHPGTDGSTSKLPAMAKRRAGEPHPYVIGSQSVGQFLTVAEECAKAGPLW